MTLTWLAKNSILLDLNFAAVSPWTINKKLFFIFVKYFLIVKHFVIAFKLSESHINFADKDIYYDSKYGLAGYQSMLTRHQHLLKISKIKNVKTIIDVGANVGFFSLLARDLYPQATIHAFEPAPQTFTCLQKNFLADKKTYVYQQGLSDSICKARMKFDPDLSATSSVNKKGKLEIDLITLDYFTRNQRISTIDLLKVDTEGFESHVLKGASKTLAKTRYLHIEVTIENNQNYTFSELLGLLNSPKYNFQLLSYRSYTDKGIGEATVFDLLLKNIKLR